jgi:hypothetical protein
MWEAGLEIVDCPTAFVEHHEGANVAVRQTNTATLDHDRKAYFDRWNGIFWNPDGPELRGRLTINHTDPFRTARRFPAEELEAATEPAIAPSITDQDAPRLVPETATHAPAASPNGSIADSAPGPSRARQAAASPERGLRARLARLIQPHQPRVKG